jgi:isopentenyl-diphosphate delta-isomerase type 1
MEMFDTFDEQGSPAGSASRADVHRLGLWHRSVQVFVFDPVGRLLLQQRSATKDVCPKLWDTSVGEHLLPGEAWEAGAKRGLKEELGIDGRDLTPLDGIRRGDLRFTELDIWDREMQQAYRCIHDGEIYVDEEEVAQVKWMTHEQLDGALLQDPQSFTPWFIDAARTLPLWSNE